MAAGNRDDTVAVPAALLAAARARDVAGVAACYAEDAVAISPMFGEARGRARIAETWSILFTGFVDVHVSVSGTLVDGNRVAVFATFSTVDALGLFGRPATGDTITYRLVLIFTVVDGFIVRDERLYDSAGLVERLEKGRLDKELRTAHEVQRALVPRTTRTHAFCESVGDSRSCRAIGGDFFEFLELPSGAVGIVLGDVSGKGPAAALLAALMQGMFAVEASMGTGPAATLSRINRRLAARQLEARFVTLVYAVLTPNGRLVYSNAGHNPPIVASRNGVRRLAAGGLALGWMSDAEFAEESIALQPGDTLVMYTDGVTEARNPDDEEFGDDRLCASIHRSEGASVTQVLDGIFEAVTDFARGAEQGDDITVTVTRLSQMA